jgi:hypothetical protein
MITDFGFLEYTYNPVKFSEVGVFSALNDMGFSLFAEHQNSTVTVWNQGRSFILLRKDSDCDVPGISGIGLYTDQIQPGLPQDNATGFSITYDPEGNRVLFFDSSIAEDQNYIRASKTKMPSNTFKNIAGVSLISQKPETEIFYQQLGFRKTKNRHNACTMVSSSNDFSIVLSEKISDNANNCIVFDTQDVFYATSKFMLNKFNLKTFDLPKNQNFGDLNYKIRGYNCLAFGNTESYSIENLCLEPLPNLDMIFRMRKQFLHLCPENLEMHYA